jgi:hypothetical protein
MIPLLNIVLESSQKYLHEFFEKTKKPSRRILRQKDKKDKKDKDKSFDRYFSTELKSEAKLIVEKLKENFSHVGPGSLRMIDVYNLTNL